MQAISLNRLAVSIILILVLIAAVPASVAQAKSGPQIPAAQRTASGRAAEGTGGPQGGIKVHGHWVIVIRDADGGIASRHEFENGLTSSGRSFLYGCLVGNGACTQVQTWQIR